jgi:hypothetical protein
MKETSAMKLAKKHYEKSNEPVVLIKSDSMSKLKLQE